MSLTNIRQLLPKDVYDAAIGANSPSAGNVFATMADVGGGGGSVGNNNYNISDGGGGFQLGLLQNATGTQITPTSNGLIALGTNSLRFSQVRTNVLYAYGTGGGSQNIRIQTGTTNPTFHGVDTSSGSDVGGLAIGSNQNVYVKFIDESTGGLKRGLLIQDTYATGTTAIRSLTMDGSAVLDLSSTERGILIPRLTFAQQTAIAAPANGLQVHIEDGTDSVPYYNHSVDGWIPVGRYAGVNNSGGVNGGIVQVAQPDGELRSGNLRLNGTSVLPINDATNLASNNTHFCGTNATFFREVHSADYIAHGGGNGYGFTGGTPVDYKMTGSTTGGIIFEGRGDIFANLQNETNNKGLSVYDYAPASAPTINQYVIAEFTSTNGRGLLIPRWTTAEETATVAALGVTQRGLQWFNTDTSQFMGWNGTAAVILG